MSDRYIFRNYAIFFFIVVILSACTNQYTADHLTASDVLQENPEADIFLHNDTVYTGNVEWVEELTLNKKDYVGEIKANSLDGDTFEEGTATKLPVGTKFYSVEERDDVLLVEDSGQTKYYVATDEG